LTVILNLSWAIVLLPLVGVGASFLAESPRRAAQTGVFFTAFALAVAVVVLVFRLTHQIPVYESTETFWDLPSTSGSTAGQPIAGEFPVLWGIRVDPLSVTFMASVLFLSLIAQVHALASLRGDAGLRRFFWVAEVLTVGLLALVASPNLFQFWLGWGVAGVAAWMLAAHHWQHGASAALATRAFVLLRVADLALLLGLIMTFTKFGLAVSQQPAPNGRTTNDPFSFSVLTPEWHLGHIGAVNGVGARSLVVIAVLFVVAATIRAALGPLHVWLSGTLDAPAAGLALIAVSALVPAALLLARVYPLLIEAPHLLTVLGLVGAAGAVAGAALALAQRDLFRIGLFAVSSQAGLILATLGMGGYSPALFIAFTGSILTVVYFLAAGNLSRGFRSREVGDCGGGRQRMPRTTLALGGWALGISGLSLNTYSALSATFRNTVPPGGGVSHLTQTLVALGVLVTMALTVLYAFRVYYVVATGEPARRRGFDVSRLREVAPQLSTTVLVALGGAAAATLVGIPGVSAFRVGATRVPGLTFSHFIFYGPFRQQLALDFTALAIAAIVCGGGAVVAWWLFSAGRRASSASVRARFASAGTALAGPTPAERFAEVLPAGFVAAGTTLDRFDHDVLDPLSTAVGDSVDMLSAMLARLRGARVGIATAAGLGVIAILLAATVLAAIGHFPVTVR
jgi:NADH:ubiquinone oxidoreductase subunit 5 (subunit L)/multisubunit Na+/H+ antiporter MnhA subunit